VFFEIVLTGLPIDRDEVEEALEEGFGSDGEVTGAGTGMGRCHLDLEVDPAVGEEDALTRINEVLVRLGVAHLARVNVGS